MHRSYLRLILIAKYLLLGFALLFFAQQEYNIYLDYSIRLKSDGIYIIRKEKNYRIFLRNIQVKFLNNAYTLRAQSDILGIITITDTKELLSIKAAPICCDELTGVFLGTRDSIIFIGKYGTMNINYEYRSSHILALSENTPYKKYQLHLNRNQNIFALDCKRFSPGIHNLTIKLHDNIGNFSGQFYQMPFWGKIQCSSDLNILRGVLWSDKLSPIKLTLSSNHTIELDSKDISGIVNIQSQSAKLNIYDHTVLLVENKLHITGPKIWISLNMNPYLQIIGPSFICNSDLLQLAWLDSADYPSSSKKYLYCDNFQAYGITMSLIEDSNKLLFSMNTKKNICYLHKTHNILNIYCSELREFSQIIENFAVTRGTLTAQGIRRDHKWHGKMQIINAILVPMYQVNKEKFCTITGSWSWDGSKLEFINLLIKNKYTEILLNGYIENDYIALGHYSKQI